MTKFFLQFTSVSAFIALAAISGFALGGNSRAQCLAIASVVADPLNCGRRPND